MTDDYATSELAAVAGATLAFIAAFLPWVAVTLGSLGSTTTKGLDITATLDGKITLALAVVVVGIVVLRDWTRLDKSAVAAIGAVTAGIAAFYLTDPAAALNASGSFAAELVTAALGLHLTALGGVVMLGAGGAAVAS